MALHLRARARALSSCLANLLPGLLLAPLLFLCAAAQAADLGIGGFGNLNSATAFNQKAIQAALPPGYTARSGKRSSEGEQYPVYFVLENGKQVMMLNDNGGKVGQIVIESPSIAAPGGARVGALYSALYPGGRAKCSPGSEEDSGTVFCIAAQANISYQFAGKWDGPDGEVPSPKVLAGWKVKRIIWAPKE